MKDIEFYENTIGKRILKAHKDKKRVSQVTLYLKPKDKYDSVGLQENVAIKDGMVVTWDNGSGFQRIANQHEYPLWEISDFGYAKRG